MKINFAYPFKETSYVAVDNVGESQTVKVVDYGNQCIARLLDNEGNVLVSGSSLNSPNVNPSRTDKNYMRKLAIANALNIASEDGLTLPLPNIEIWRTYNNQKPGGRWDMEESVNLLPAPQEVAV